MGEGRGGGRGGAIAGGGAPGQWEGAEGSAGIPPRDQVPPASAPRSQRERALSGRLERRHAGPPPDMPDRRATTVALCPEHGLAQNLGPRSPWGCADHCYASRVTRVAAAAGQDIVTRREQRAAAWAAFSPEVQALMIMGAGGVVAACHWQGGGKRGTWHLHPAAGRSQAPLALALALVPSWNFLPS